jgi:hypothetical protein
MTGRRRYKTCDVNPNARGRKATHRDERDDDEEKSSLLIK